MALSASQKKHSNLRESLFASKSWSIKHHLSRKSRWEATISAKRHAVVSMVSLKFSGKVLNHTISSGKNQKKSAHPSLKSQHPNTSRFHCATPPVATRRAVPSPRHRIPRQPVRAASIRWWSSAESLEGLATRLSRKNQAWKLEIWWVSKNGTPKKLVAIWAEFAHGKLGEVRAWRTVALPEVPSRGPALWSLWCDGSETIIRWQWHLISSVHSTYSTKRVYSKWKFGEWSCPFNA